MQGEQLPSPLVRDNWRVTVVIMIQVQQPQALTWKPPLHDQPRQPRTADSERKPRADGQALLPARLLARGYGPAAGREPCH